MEKIFPNIGVILILLLFALYLHRLFRFILPVENLADNRKYIKLARYLFLVAAIVYSLQYIGGIPLSSTSARVITHLVLSGIVLIISLCFVIITKGNRWQYAAIGGFVLSVIGAGYCFNEKLASSMSFEITLSETQIELRGGYTLNIPFATASGIVLENKFPDVAYRSNGISVKDKNIGYYVLNNGKKCFLFLNNKSSLFIHIERINDIPVFINCSTPEETVRLYRQILIVGKYK
ncbi:hypothetical protein [Bacteroides heparinolyticus]|uniref:hypothetical protein n=1 Tax=Prevotella heparinolytica TaxID=28113 RepID=UPI00359F3B7A